MSTSSVQPPFEIFTDIDGQPLEDGYIWLGTAGLPAISNPITAYWDAAGTIAAAQPIRTIGGYPMNSGTPATLYVASSDYSILVQNKNGSSIYSSLTATERYSSALVTFLQAGANAVVRTAQSKMRDIVSVKDFGAVGDGVTDDTATIQSAIDAGIASNLPWVLNFPVGEYLVSDELDFTAATKSFSITGASREKTIIRATAFGTAKKLFKGADASNPIYIELNNFSIRGVNNTRDKAHPIGIYFPNASRVMFSELSSAAWGNSVIQIGPGFNSDINNVELFTSGWQPLYKEVASTVVVSTVSGSPNITANTPIFSPSDVGQTIYVQQIAASAGNPSNSALVAVIASYTSTIQVTLDRDCFVTSAAKSISFDSVKASINSGSNVLAFNASCLTNDDVGRIISIPNAVSGTGGMLVTKVSNVTGATQCELVDAASKTVTDGYVWFSPSIYVGEQLSAAGSTPINDLTFSDLHIEQYRGPAVILDRGTAVHLTRFKTHGRAWSQSNNFADSRQAIIFNENTRNTVSQYQLEFGCFGLSSGPVVATGTVSVSLDQGTIAGTAHGGYIFEFVTASEQSILNVGAITCNAVDWTKMAGFVNSVGTTAERNLVSSGAAPTSISFGVERSVAFPPSVSGQFRSMTPVTVSDDTAISLPSFRTQGFVLLSTDATTVNGMFWYRVDGAPNLQQIYAGANLDNTTGPLTGTTGADNKMTISAANDRKIYVENRIGASRVITLTLLGG